MKKIFTFLLLLLVGLHSTAALCLCSHEVEVSSHHCHEESGEASQSAANSHEHSSPSSSHSQDQEKGQNCCCIQEASDLPSKLEITSPQNQIQNLVWVTYHTFLSTDISEQYSFRITHDLSPPVQASLYLKKSSFLI